MLAVRLYLLQSTIVPETEKCSTYNNLSFVDICPVFRNLSFLCRSLTQSCLTLSNIRGAQREIRKDSQASRVTSTGGNMTKPSLVRICHRDGLPTVQSHSHRSLPASLEGWTQNQKCCHFVNTAGLCEAKTWDGNLWVPLGELGWRRSPVSASSTSWLTLLLAVRQLSVRPLRR